MRIDGIGRDDTRLDEGGFEHAQSVGAESQLAVDKIHQQFKVDTWVRGAGGVGELLVDLVAEGD